MVRHVEALSEQNNSLILNERKPKKHFKLIEATYKNNTSSDYTEKIEELDKSFNYSSNSNYYWSAPEQSLLYGTPLYKEASPSQKIALNHLHWFAKYNYTAETEAETVAFNQITSGVFDAIGGYETLCKELELETTQEYVHIHAFRKMGLMTAFALIGKKPLQALQKSNSYKLTSGFKSSSMYEHHALRSLAKLMLSNTKQYYSKYLSQLEEHNQFITAPTKGIAGRVVKPSLLNFFGFNWGGGSPFLACQYYTLRMMGNMLLKSMEHSISKYYRNLEYTGEFIPTPTAVSRYHFLDESFHTTTSQLIAKEMYKDFSKPTAYEKFIANLSIYMTQRGSFGGLSGVFPHRYLRDDHSLMILVYQLLQSPLFGMSAQDALHWTEQCFCCEHEGFHVALKNHQHLLSEYRHFFDGLDYLWAVNRQMQMMASGGSISKAIQNNIKLFQQFSKSETS